ncbi:MAG: FeoC-like transcriptional regulator [Cyanobacteria bacterium SID2]|nr:FeoC-like transcriptional regulator [Cyanobacteria bacterium SID2]MBP0004810.1 FeoC-like transcriptional regulator [Cyanobacteria bacterium SBC]
MILRDLQTYLKERGKVPLSEIAMHFRMDGKALQPMLEKLVRKGRVRQLPGVSSCGECCKCDPALLEVYEWVEQ